MIVEIHLTLLLPYLLAFGVSLAPVVLFLLWHYWRRWVRRNRPRPAKMLSGPGDSQRGRIADLDEAITAAALWLVAIPVAAIATLLAPRLLGVGPLTGADLFALPALAAGLLCFPFFALIRNCRQRRGCRRKLEAEISAGREINQLLRDGFQVFHDVPEGGGNIDHMVIGLSGVFTVESLGRPVPEKGRGIIDAKVIYDGENLFFPPDNAKEGGAAKQARRQAIAMERFLGDALGVAVPVRPALALPGWFVERKRADDLLLLYGQAHHYARILRGPTVLTPDRAREIGRVLEARCRGIELSELAGEGERTKGAAGNGGSAAPLAAAVLSVPAAPE